MTKIAPLGNASKTARVIAVTSGKGGVGKTNIAVSLSLALADLGNKVTLVDMDLGLGNVNTIMKLNPESDLGDVINGTKELEAIIIKTTHGLNVVPGVSGDEHLANLRDDQKEKLVKAMEKLCKNNDYVIIDTGAGISHNTTIFTTTADEAIVITTPEPTAMMDSYAAIKIIKNKAPDIVIHLIVNMTRSEKEALATMQKMESMAQHFIHGHLEEDGYVPMDNQVMDAVRHRQPFILYNPSCDASMALVGIANVLTNFHTSPHGQVRVEKESFFNRLMNTI